MTTPPATSGPSAPEPSVVNPPQPSGPPKERHTWLIVFTIICVDLLLVLFLIGFVGLWLAAGEWICLDRRPWWGPPESGVNTDCSGHIDELLRKWGWVS